MSAKFNEHERKRIGAINAMFGIVGVTMGMMIPAALINYDDESTYVFAASVVAGISIVLAILMQFGIRENAELKAQAEKNYEQPKFITSLKMCLKSKNFLAHVAFTLGQGVLTTLMLGSLQYWNQFIIGSNDAMNEILVGGALLGGSIVSIPIWFLIDKRIGTKKSMYIGGFITSGMLLGFFFFGTTLIGGIIFAGLIGVSLGSMWTNLYVSLADVIMEFNAMYGTFSEGVWTGVRMFFNRLSFVVQSISILVIQTLTGFDELEDVQTPEAQVGLRIIMAVIPCFFYFLGSLLMLVWYDLTPEKLATLEEK